MGYKSRALLKFETKSETIQRGILLRLKERGYTNEEFAEELGLPYRTIQRNTLALNAAGKIIGILSGDGKAIWRLSSHVKIYPLPN